MKTFTQTLFAIALVTPLIASTALAFSASPREYSRHAFSVIASDLDVMSQIPTDETVTSIKDTSVGKGPYTFEVSAESKKGEHCTLTVELSTTTPKGFIGTGLPHSPKVVNASSDCGK